MRKSLHDVCRAIHRDTDAIIERWLDAAKEEPWFSMPRERMVDKLPHVIGRLADVALLAPGDEQLHREKVLAAARHGEERREQGIPTEAIFREYHFLRVSLWRYLESTLDEDHTRLEAITRIDLAISIACRASLYGYHRQELQKSGDWPGRVEKLASESSLLTLHDDSNR